LFHYSEDTFLKESEKYVDVIILSKGSKAVALEIKNKIESQSPDLLIHINILKTHGYIKQGLNLI
jgi:hypothetical protein